MLIHIFVCSFLFIFLSTVGVFADVTVAPSDIKDVLRQISEYQKKITGPLKEKAHVKIKNGQIFFASDVNGLDAVVSFTDKSLTIEKHIKLKNNDSEYSFEAILDNKTKIFNHVIEQIDGADALVFFSEDEVFIYTQSTGTDGGIELKEWVYARRPNSRHGSYYRWIFKPELWQWPLTLEMNSQGQVGIFRNMPLSGTPFTDTARRQHVANVVDKVFKKYKISVYFPFHEQVAGIPPITYWNREGKERQADVRVSDDPMALEQSKDPMVQVWSAWESKLQDVFEIVAKASRNEYPLLIDP